MNRIVQASACLLAGAAAFLLGRDFGDERPPASPLARLKTTDGIILPNPNQLAQTARIELEAIPQDVWSILPPATNAFVSALPALQPPPASAAAPQPARPAPEAKPRLEAEIPAAIAASLSQSISAIVRSNGAVRLVLADRNTTVRRSLVIGDVFQDGWKLSRIDQGSITLTRLGRSLQVPVAYSVNPRRAPSLTPLAAVAIPSTENHARIGARSPVGASRRRVSRRDAAEN